jgi:sulfonate transport system substrate-binding protein
MRRRIVDFVRALIDAVRLLRVEPDIGWRLVADAAELDLETVRDAWPFFDFPATLAPDLLDVLVREEPWVAEMQGRAPRDRATLARLIDDSVLKEALTP